MARLDAEIFKRGLAQSRSRAEELIYSGSVLVNGFVCKKPSKSVVNSDIILVNDTIGYVSRAGLKLEYALKQFQIDCTDKIVLDIGASTGGFTQCLLKNNASAVWAVDVGRGQMAAELAQHKQVKLYEGVNARTLTPEFLGGIADMAVMDVSFISQTLLYPSVFQCVDPQGTIIVLIKPQFEAGPEHINKNGIVKDKKAHIDVINKIIHSVSKFGRYLNNIVKSPILGGDGNIEYLAILESNPEKSIDAAYFVNTIWK